MENIILDPVQVSFTAGLISPEFDDGSLVLDMSRDLKSGSISVLSIPKIRVARLAGVYFALDNRTLYAVRMAELASALFVITPVSLGSLDLTSALPRTELPQISEAPIRWDRPFSDLGYEICMWTPGQLRSPAYANKSPFKCRAIDERWAETASYYLAFMEPLLDEVFAGLRSGIGCAPQPIRANGLSYTPRDGDVQDGDVQIDNILTVHCDGQGEFIPRMHPGDAVLFCCNGVEALGYVARVKMVSHAERVEWRLKHRGENPPQILEVRTLLDLELADLDPRRFTFRVLDSVGPYSRIYNAIVAKDPGPLFMKMILDPLIAIQYDRLCKPVYSLMDPVEARLGLEELVRQTESSTFNESQTDAILSAVAGTCPITLISGPPGTGKTSVIVATILTLLRAEHPVLQTAATNLAVAEVAQRVMSQLSRVSNMKISRLVLPGHSERLNLDSTGLRRIHLFSRVNRLQSAYEELPKRCIQLHQTTSLLQQYIENLLATQSALYSSMEVRIQDRNARFICKTLLGPWREEAAKIQIMIESFLDDVPQAVEPLMKNVSALLKETKATAQALSAFFERAVQEGEGTTQLSAHGFSLRDPCAQALSHIDQLRDAIEPVRNWEKSRGCIPWSDHILSEAAVIFCTLAVASNATWKKRVFGNRIIIVDEAGQAPEAAMLPLMTGSCLRLILVGDAKQLPAVVSGQGARDAGFGTSLFERLEKLRFPAFQLAIQYRMHPEISAFPRERFYQGAVSDGELVKVPTYRRPWFDEKDFPPCSFINFFQKGEAKDEATMSIYNAVEAGVVKKLLLDLLPHFRMHLGNISVGVISGYAKQVKTIASRISKISGCRSVGETEQGAASFVVNNVSIDVGSVDSFQGQERDVVILATTRANEPGVLGFLQDERRVNVALTRARFSLFIIGDRETLRRSELWTDLLQNLDSRRLTHDLHTHPRFSKYVSLSEVQKSIIQHANMNTVKASGGFTLPSLEDMPWTMQITEAALSSLKTEACRTDANLLNSIFQLQSGN